MAPVPATARNARKELMIIVQSMYLWLFNWQPRRPQLFKSWAKSEILHWWHATLLQESGVMNFSKGEYFYDNFKALDNYI